VIHISPALDGEDDDQATWSAVWSGFAGPCVAAMGETIREVATRFSVSPSYVSKVRARLRATGQATPGPQHNHVRPRLEPYYDVLRARVGEQSDATIAELRAWMAQEHGVAVSHPVMWETLRRLGLTLKKASPCGGAGSAGHCRGTRRLEQPATKARCFAADLPGRDLGHDEHGAQPRPRAARRAPGSACPVWSLAHDDLSLRPST
jgi:transposase